MATKREASKATTATTSKGGANKPAATATTSKAVDIVLALVAYANKVQQALFAAGGTPVVELLDKVKDKNARAYLVGLALGATFDRERANALWPTVVNITGVYLSEGKPYGVLAKTFEVDDKGKAKAKLGRKYTEGRHAGCLTGERQRCKRAKAYASAVAFCGNDDNLQLLATAVNGRLAELGKSERVEVDKLRKLAQRWEKANG